MLRIDEHLDTIYLELVINACQMSREDIWISGALEIRLNDKKPYADSDIINEHEFFKSIDSEGEFEIFSCCCGVPECSGWIKGIQVDHIDHQLIKWTNLNNGDSWIFKRQMLDEDLKEIQEKLENYKSFFNEKGISYVGYGY
ncbi:hypothetical protein CLU96_3772 [Chryseobacterium sp. 52]|uniref:hypothetical protein n=1 Tax=Chryseobacterium sp. 52 TaxID=2035213 RepID=UPI000C1A2DE0|nr:hypothetical protein [Chryseobacterium sp. 52]PIF46732.1 hypothetical protein CLU96_3772 [Chryseobacterium sp. 52]